MTLVVAVTAEKSIWMMTDRRITFRHKNAKDNARKVMCLETTDGVAFLGYAGLGCTALGTEPSVWMSNVLRGMNLQLEQSLAIIAKVALEQIPKHLTSLPNSALHNVIIPAFHNGKPKLYTIDIHRIVPHGTYSLTFARRVSDLKLTSGYITPRIAVGGSGATHLKKNRIWARNLLKVIDAHDAGRISAQSVAKTLAQLNNQVSRTEKTVGKKCMVMWRLSTGGGALECFDGEEKDTSPGTVFIPTIGQGRDISSIAETIMPFLPTMRGVQNEESKARIIGKINAVLSKLSEFPDDRLN